MEITLQEFLNYSGGIFPESMLPQEVAEINAYITTAKQQRAQAQAINAAHEAAMQALRDAPNSVVYDAAGRATDASVEAQRALEREIYAQAAAQSLAEQGFVSSTSQPGVTNSIAQTGIISGSIPKVEAQQASPSPLSLEQIINAYQQYFGRTPNASEINSATSFQATRNAFTNMQQLQNYLKTYADEIKASTNSLTGSTNNNTGNTSTGNTNTSTGSTNTSTGNTNTSNQNVNTTSYLNGKTNTSNSILNTNTSNQSGNTNGASTAQPLSMDAISNAFQNYFGRGLSASELRNASDFQSSPGAYTNEQQLMDFFASYPAQDNNSYQSELIRSLRAQNSSPVFNNTGVSMLANKPNSSQTLNFKQPEPTLANNPAVLSMPTLFGNPNQNGITAEDDTEDDTANGDALIKVLDDPYEQIRQAG